MAIVQLFDYAAAKQALHDWLTLVTGFSASQVRWGQQDSNVPTRPYATMNITADNPPAAGGYDERTFYYDPAGLGEMSELISGARELVLSVNIYTDKVTALTFATTREAMDVARDVRGTEQLLSARQVLADAGLTLVEIGAAIDLSEVDGEQWIARAGLDVRMAYSSNITEAATAGTGWISTMELTRTVEAEGATITDIMTLPE